MLSRQLERIFILENQNIVFSQKHFYNIKSKKFDENLLNSQL